jgi:catechol 2,3-dioxygenase-like lactoylglutathione lyase family enzyme
LGRVLETGVYAEDLDAAERFYAEVLGLEVLLREEGRHVFFRFPGDGPPGEAGVFLVFNPQASAEASEGPEGGGVIPGHGAHGPSHMAFAIEDGKVEAWRSHLVKHGVAIESEVVKPDGRGRSLYFRDPAGNSIELATPGIWDVDET